MVQYVQSLTDRNLHTEARIYIAANILKDEELTKQYEAIRETHNRQGYLTHEQCEERGKIDKSLKIQLIQRDLTDYYFAL